jgi:DnaJ-domain-containing protein 1
LPRAARASKIRRMPGPAEADLRRTLGCGELVRLVYRLGRHAASGVLTLAAPTSRVDPRVDTRLDTRTDARPEVFVLRRGGALCAEGELGRRAVGARLARAAAEPLLAARFESGVAAYPPGAVNQLSLAVWARSHIEGRFDGALAEAVVRELDGRRLALRPELAPDPADDADRRMLAAMAQPRRLDQIWPIARTPRYRMLAFLHMLRSLGALDVEAPTQSSYARASTTGPRSADVRRAAAMRVLGLDGNVDADDVKRAYRRLARTLHPDLQPGADDEHRRLLERRFSELTAAYEALV